MRSFDAISIHPEIQDGAPVFSGTRIPVETFFDYMRIGVSINEFLDEFPSITRDQAMEVYQLATDQFSMDAVYANLGGPDTTLNMPAPGRLYASA